MTHTGLITFWDTAGFYLNNENLVLKKGLIIYNQAFFLPQGNLFLQAY